VSSDETTTRAPMPRVSLEASMASELSNLLNVVAASQSLAADVILSARVELIGAAGRVARAILEARRHGVSLRLWLDVNRSLRHLESAARLLLPSARISLELDPAAGSVNLAPGELELAILNLLFDARSRLGENGALEIRSERTPTSLGEAVTISVEDLPDRAPCETPGTTFGIETVRMIARDARGTVSMVPGRAGGVQVRLLLPTRTSSGS
jgi:hypothetical protein